MRKHRARKKSWGQLEEAIQEDKALTSPLPGNRSQPCQKGKAIRLDNQAKHRDKHSVKNLPKTQTTDNSEFATTKIEERANVKLDYCIVVPRFGWLARMAREQPDLQVPTQPGDVTGANPKIPNLEGTTAPASANSGAQPNLKNGANSYKSGCRESDGAEWEQKIAAASSQLTGIAVAVSSATKATSCNPRTSPKSVPMTVAVKTEAEGAGT